MDTWRAIKTGVLVWAAIFIEWSIIIFTPILKDLGNWQYLLHYILLFPIVYYSIQYYYKNKGKVNGFALGLVVLLVGVILDSIITVPLFTIPQGVGFVDFFFNPLMLIGYAELIMVSGYYWFKEVKKK